MCGNLQPNTSFVTNCSFLKSNRYLCAKLPSNQKHVLLSGFVCFAFLTMQSMATCDTKPLDNPTGSGGLSVLNTQQNNTPASKKTYKIQRDKRLNPERKRGTEATKGHKKRSARIKLPSSVPCMQYYPCRVKRSPSTDWSFLPSQ